MSRRFDDISKPLPAEGLHKPVLIAMPVMVFVTMMVLWMLAR